MTTTYNIGTINIIFANPKTWKLVRNSDSVEICKSALAGIRHPEYRLVYVGKEVDLDKEEIKILHILSEKLLLDFLNLKIGALGAGLFIIEKVIAWHVAGEVPPSFVKIVDALMKGGVSIEIGAESW